MAVFIIISINIHRNLGVCNTHRLQRHSFVYIPSPCSRFHSSDRFRSYPHTACSRNWWVRWKQLIHIQLWLKLLWKQFVGWPPLFSCKICIERCEIEPSWGVWETGGWCQLKKMWKQSKVNPFIQLGLCILRRCETNRMTEKRLRNFPVLEPKSSVKCSPVLRRALYFVTASLKICDGVGSSPVSLAGPPKTRAMVKMVRATQDQWSFIAPISHCWLIFPQCLLTKKSTEIPNRNLALAFPWFLTSERVDVQWPKWSGQSQLVDGGEPSSTELCQQIMRSAASL